MHNSQLHRKIFHISEFSRPVIFKPAADLEKSHISLLKALNSDISYETSDQL